MVSVLSNRLTGALAGWLYLGGGLIVGLSLFLPMPETVNRPGAFGLCGIGVLIGVMALRAPWDDWPRSRTLLMVPVTFAMLTFGGVFMFDLIEYAYGVFWMLTFTWVGLGQARWTSIRIAPFALVSFAIPLINFTGDWFVGVRTAAIVIPAGVLIGELLAWISHQLESSETRDAQHIESQRALLEASTTLAYQVDYDTASYLVARMSGELLGGAATMVLLADDLGLTAIGCWPEPVEEIHIPASECTVLLDAIREDRALHVATDDPCPVRDLLHVQSLFLMPIRGASRPIGAIAVGFVDETRRLDDFEQDLGHTFAMQAGLAFERVWATQSLLDESLRDELTGVGNRRHVSALLGHVQPGDAIVMLDLDHFKNVNDTLGHATGDEVLHKLGVYLRSALRENDAVARYGGEEFLVLLRRAGAGSVTKAEELLEGWRRTSPVVTFSAGVAVHDIASTPLGTMKQADEALYLAKSRGRNRVCSAMDSISLK